MSNKFDFVLFDFDGTLTDSSEGIFKSLKYAFEQYGHSEPDEALLRRFIGPPLHYSFTQFCGFTPEHAEEMTEKYRERYRVKGYLESVIYDGVRETLEALKKRGVVMATASSKPLKFVSDICKNLDIKRYFDYMGGTAFDSISETKAQVIENAMRALGAAKDNTLMVGDRMFDIDGAHEVGIPCCAVMYGFGSREEFLEHGAEYTVDTPREILDLL